MREGFWRAQFLALLVQRRVARRRSAGRIVKPECAQVTIPPGSLRSPADPETWSLRVAVTPSVHSASLRYIGAVVRFPRVPSRVAMFPVSVAPHLASWPPCGWYAREARDLPQQRSTAECWKGGCRAKRDRGIVSPASAWIGAPLHKGDFFTQKQDRRSGPV